MRRILNRSVSQRALLAVLALILALAPTATAAASTVEEPTEAAVEATEAPATEAPATEPAADPATEPAEDPALQETAAEPPTEPPVTEPADDEVTDTEPSEDVTEASDPKPAANDPPDDEEPAAARQLTTEEDEEDADEEADDGLTAAAIDFGNVPVFGDPNHRSCNLAYFRYTDGHEDNFWYCGPQGDVDQSKVPTLHVREIHISCSEVFGGGNISGDPSHKVAEWRIVRYRNGEVWRNCGRVEIATPAITLDKTADKTTARVGDTVTYTYEITNSGDVSLSDITLTDDILGNLTSRLSTRTLARGEKTTVTGVQHVVTAADLTRGSIHNTAATTGRSPDDRTVRDEDEWTVTVDVTPALSGSLDCTALTVNTNVPITSVALTFDARDGGGSQTFNNPATGTTSFAGTGGNAGKVISSATVTSSVASLTRTFNQTNACVPAITVDKTANTTTAQVGDTVTYSYVITNTGEVTLNNLTLVDDKLGSLSGRITVSSLAAGASTTVDGVTHVVTAADRTAGAIRNVAEATGRSPDGETVRDDDDWTVTVNVTPALTATLDCTSLAVTTNVPVTTVTLNFDSRMGGGSQVFANPPANQTTFAGTLAHAGKVISSATVTSSVASLSRTLNQANACVPAIEVDKTANTTTAQVGDTVTYSYLITNRGEVTLNNLTLVDDKLGSLSGRITVASLAPGASTTVAGVTHVVTAADLTAGSIVNVATATGRSPDNRTVQDTDNWTVNVGTTPAITITKNFTQTPLVKPQTVTSGGTATWVIQVTNTGNSRLDNVTVSDPRAPGCDRNLGSLAVGESQAHTCSLANVTQSLVNRADVVGTSPTGVQVTDFDTAPVTVIPADAPAILITKNFSLTPLLKSQTVGSGGTASWVIQVTNTGNTLLNNVTVTDPLASGCERNLGTLAAGQSAPVYPCSLGPVFQGFTNRAIVVGTTTGGVTVTDFDDAPVDVFTIIEGPGPSVVLNKTATAPECPKAGDVVTYRFEVINNGLVALNNITLNDPMLGGAVTLPATSLASGQTMNATANHVLTQAEITAGSLANTASINATSATTGAAASSSDGATVMLEDCPGIELDKDGPDEAQVGDEIRYTFTVQNTGNVRLTDVRITDERLGVFGLPVAPPNLEPGEFGTATATYTVTQEDEDLGEIINTALARGKTPDGTELTHTDDHRTIVPPGPITPEQDAPDIRLEKDGPRRAEVGETVRYEFTVTNTGNVTLSNVNITDRLLGLDRLAVRPSTLAPDEQGTATVTYVITEADADAGSVYNTAVARGRDPEGTPVRDRDDHTITVPGVPPVCVSPPCGPPPPRPLPPPDLPATGLGTSGFALTALLSLALGGVLLGIAGTGNLQTAMANSTVNADSPMLAMLRRWNLAPKPGGSQARRRRRR